VPQAFDGPASLQKVGLNTFGPPVVPFFQKNSGCLQTAVASSTTTAPRFDPCVWTDGRGGGGGGGISMVYVIYNEPRRPHAAQKVLLRLCLPPCSSRSLVQRFLAKFDARKLLPITDSIYILNLSPDFSLTAGLCSEICSIDSVQLLPSR
jgi:hypothetical protein